MTPDTTPCRVGLWGAFDVEDHGQALYTMVMRAELARRLPAAQIRVFSPDGRPTRADRGEPAEPLGEWSDARAAELAGELDFVVIGGSGLAATGNRFLTTGLGDAVPVRWHLTDETPHPAVLLPRLLDPAVVEKRLEYLRVMGWYPRDGEALLVQGADDNEIPGILHVLADHPGMTQVDIDRLPATISVEDVAAAVAGAAGFIGASAAACLVAAGYGRPWVLLTRNGSQPAGIDEDHVVREPDHLHEAFARAVKTGATAESLQAEVDASLDGFAAEAAAAGAARHPDGLPDPSRRALESELAALRRAYRARVERSYQERVVLADHAARGAPEDTEQLRRRLAEAEAQLAALRNTRTFRWTSAARSAYRMLRERRP